MRHRAMFWPGVLLIALGIALAILPKDWIEGIIGFEPDGGNGIVEFAMALVPMLLGAGLLVAPYLHTPRRIRDRAGS